jgi:hypothetical protein
MGFYSTIIGQDYPVNLPRWFGEKYEKYITIKEGLIASKMSAQFYGTEFFDDYQTALNEACWFDRINDAFPLTVVVLSEDDDITKVTITRDKIEFEIAAQFVSWGAPYSPH